MQHVLWKDARSTLLDGIETVLVPISHPVDLNRLATEASRGTYAVAEWILNELGRWAELDRVCGLSVSTAGGVVVHLELRQPGKQIEEWIKVHGWTWPPLSARAMSAEKFTDKHQPWWVLEQHAS